MPACGGRACPNLVQMLVYMLVYTKICHSLGPAEMVKQIGFKLGGRLLWTWPSSLP